MIDRTQRRVVCAAIMHENGDMILGARHFDKLMHETIALIGGQWRDAEQGFIDQWGHFMDRERAFIVATEAKQILHKTGNPDSPELYSEDLY